MASVRGNPLLQEHTQGNPQLRNRATTVSAQWQPATSGEHALGNQLQHDNPPGNPPLQVNTRKATRHWHAGALANREIGRTRGGT